jgi:predicted RecA/RadA family phage recombinase
VANEATFLRDRDRVSLTAQAAANAGEVWQLADGRAGYLALTGGASAATGAASGDRTQFRTDGQVTMPKAAGFVGLDGGRAYWDWSANQVTFQRVDDRDFYLGRSSGTRRRPTRPAR